MNSKIKLFFILFLVNYLLQAQVSSPEAFLGYQLGDRFTRHHQVMNYFDHLDQNSDQIKLQSYGWTNEQRPLKLAFISTKKNLDNLDQIQQDNLKRAHLKAGVPTTSVAIVWLSYNVHGNESVSTETAMMTAYALTKPNSSYSSWLENTVVIIDPCVNPDGRERYVSFYYQFGNQSFNPNADSWEHREGWPNGRANHYLFDLNRDWAWQTQVESKQRLAVYNNWLPQIHVDFHEMGVEDPYYFAPAAVPYHEQITKWQREFQVSVGRNHAKYFDQEGWLYFTKEHYDLLYPSYGDTYPTYNGAIGMTYEQGGSGRGGLGVIKSTGDTLTLKDRIAHHHTTGLSTIEMAAKNQVRLLEEFDRFFTERPQAPFGSYVLRFENQLDKKQELMQWLDQQHIQYGAPENIKKVSGYSYESKKTVSLSLQSEDLIVSADQPKSRLVHILFEPEPKLEDSLTYDITAWSMAYAYGVSSYGVQETLPTKNLSEVTFTPNDFKEDYAMLFSWQHMADARFLAALIQAGIKVRYTTKPVIFNNKVFNSGSLLVTRVDNPSAVLREKTVALANLHKRPLTHLNTGLAAQGSDIGSDSYKFIQKPEIAVIGGPGVSSLDYGTIWYYMEQVLGYPVTNLSTSYLESVDLNQFDVIFLPDGNYGDFTSWGKLKDWVTAGGTLVALQQAVGKVGEQLETNLSKFNNAEEEQEMELMSQTFQNKLQFINEKDVERQNMQKELPGAIIKLKLDVSHPLAFGMNPIYYTLKTSPRRFGLLAGSNIGFIDNQEDVMAGFVGSEVRKNLAKSLVFGVEAMGRGQIVYLLDNPLYRGFWKNGHLLIANALFMVPAY